MSLAYPHDRLQLPEALRRQLHDFRRRVWIDQDGGGDLHRGLRGGGRLPAHVPARPRLRHAAAGSAPAVRGGVRRLPGDPAAIYRWIWRNRRLEQLAMLLARKHPAVGDQLLGIIELVRNDFEQARSRRSCEAAVREVAKDAQSRDFSDAVPRPRHKSWASTAAVPIVAAIALGMAFPAAAAAPGRGSSRLGRRAALYLRRARGPAVAPGRPPRRAVHRHGPAGRARPSGDPKRGRGPARGPAPVAARARGRPVRVQHALADRARLADHQRRRRLAADPASSRPCVPS